MAVHLSLEVKQACSRPDIPVGVDWKFSAYKYSNAARCFRATMEMLLHLHERNSGISDVDQQMANVVKALVQLKVVTWNASLRALSKHSSRITQHMLAGGTFKAKRDLERGSQYVITSFPTPDSITGYQKVTPNPQRLIEEQVGEDYIVRTQRPNYPSEAGWRNEAERPGYVQAKKLRFLRPYQLKAIHRLQTAVGDGKDRFLFEMATGTGKTLTAAAVIKLFLRSGNVRRVLFLVDRLELKDQAAPEIQAIPRWLGGQCV